MSFRCEVCGKVQGVREKPQKVVTEVREVTYPTVRDSMGRVKTPQGYEISKEVTACSTCAAKKMNVMIVGKKVLE